MYDSFWGLMQALYERFQREAARLAGSKAWQPPADFARVQYDWRPFLEQYSRDLIAKRQPIDSDDWPDEVIGSGWVGYPGATEAQITALETRIGARLPPSYRQFLAVSNGWRNTGAFIYKMWSAEEVEWFRVRNQEWIDIWNSIDDDDSYPDHEGRGMKTALEISDTGDAAILLLNPQVITPDGEWEAWFFSNWNPGARRYASFWDLMHAQYKTMISLVDHEDKRLSAKVDLTQLSVKLPGLVAELRSRAAIWTSLPQGFPSGHNEGQAQALNEMADAIQALVDALRPPPETLAALHALAEQAEREQAIAEELGHEQIESALGKLSRRQRKPGTDHEPISRINGSGKL